MRDITALGGLRERMAVTFIAAVFAGISMLGLPPALGYFAKDEMYLGVFGGNLSDIVLLVVMVLGNAALGAIALALMIKPFMGPAVAMPKAPQEGPFGMLLALAILAAAGIVAGWQIGWLSLAVASPAGVSGEWNGDREPSRIFARSTEPDPLAERRHLGAWRRRCTGSSTRCVALRAAFRRRRG